MVMEGSRSGVEKTSLSEAYIKAREVLEERGFTVFVIEPKSLAQLMMEEEEYFGNVEGPPSLRRNFIPEAIEIAISPGVRLPESNDLVHFEAVEMIENWRERFREETGLADDIKIRMGYAPELAQADIAYRKQNNGRPLFPDFFARALDNTDGLLVAYVGRDSPDDRLNVSGWRTGPGFSNVWVVPVVVLPRK